ncbi:hypothetical protein [Photobacterium galatheae]|uniref:Uncharacterized protein n=1 Tax=Photobacterium galatheae TaxID=1654360 RepID=A0A066RT19_9GAMM|nr:hypothetical protein [Photobacterium galatheae]KDM90837.1 hypothetical protein EA58_13840 [Photobacterium galatheae]MCM0149195.1 hypothetical protein [Photobacterium galatheae]
MNNLFNFKTIASIMIASSLTHIAFAAPTLPSTHDDVMLQYYKENEKYACTPEELADFLKDRRQSLAVTPNIMNADKFVQNEAAQKKDDPDNCLTLFDNLKVVEDIQKLIAKIQKLKMPDFSTDGMGAAAQALATQLFDAAMESVCNALTKEAAEKLINEVMNRQLGFDINDVKEFDPKEFAKDMALDHAGAYLESEGIDEDWLDQENHKDLMKDEIGNQKEQLVEQAFEK